MPLIKIIATLLFLLFPVFSQELYEAGSFCSNNSYYSIFTTQNVSLYVDFNLTNYTKLNNKIIFNATPGCHNFYIYADKYDFSGNYNKSKIYRIDPGFVFFIKPCKNFTIISKDRKIQYYTRDNLIAIANITNTSYLICDFYSKPNKIENITKVWNLSYPISFDEECNTHRTTKGLCGGCNILAGTRPYYFFCLNHKKYTYDSGLLIFDFYYKEGEARIILDKSHEYSEYAFDGSKFYARHYIINCHHGRCHEKKVEEKVIPYRLTKGFHSFIIYKEGRNRSLYIDNEFLMQYNYYIDVGDEICYDNYYGSGTYIGNNCASSILLADAKPGNLTLINYTKKELPNFFTARIVDNSSVFVCLENSLFNYSNCSNIVYFSNISDKNICSKERKIIFYFKNKLIGIFNCTDKLNISGFIFEFKEIPQRHFVKYNNSFYFDGNCTYKFKNNTLYYYCEDLIDYRTKNFSYINKKLFISNEIYYDSYIFNNINSSFISKILNKTNIFIKNNKVYLNDSIKKENNCYYFTFDDSIDLCMKKFFDKFDFYMNDSKSEFKIEGGFACGFGNKIKICKIKEIKHRKTASFSRPSFSFSIKQYKNKTKINRTKTKINKTKINQKKYFNVSKLKKVDKKISLEGINVTITNKTYKIELNVNQTEKTKKHTKLKMGDLSILFLILVLSSVLLIKNIRNKFSIFG